MSIKQGSIVLVDFSYSNLKETKFRPALVISSSEYNEDSIDVVVLRVTSRSRDRKWNLEILKNDVAEGTIGKIHGFLNVQHGSRPQGCRELLYYKELFFRM